MQKLNFSSRMERGGWGKNEMENFENKKPSS
jgi:hypothetical protein